MSSDGYGAEGREEDRKIFVGGLSWETTEEDIRAHFQHFGDVVTASLKTDPNTGRSRGFAFVTFQTASAAKEALTHPDHMINNKNVDAKRVKPQATNTKVFVGGLKPDVTEQDVRDHFNTIGAVTDIEIPMDKVKNQHKGFCFVTFESEEVVRDLVASGQSNINGNDVDVRRATPKSERAQTQRNGVGGGGYGAYAGYGAGDAYGYGYGYPQAAAGYGGYDYSGYGAAAGYGAAYAGYAGYGADAGVYNGKQAGAGRANARHQPY